MGMGRDGNVAIIFALAAPALLAAAGLALDFQRLTSQRQALQDAADIYLTAPKTGLMAGLLIWESKNAAENRVHKILSANARELLGTFYLPRGELEVKSGSPIADSSAYTAIIAKRFSMAGSPTLVLNTDYAATDVPTPEGVGATGGQVYLRN